MMTNESVMHWATSWLESGITTTEERTRFLVGLKNELDQRAAAQASEGKIRSDLTKAEASIVEHKLQLRDLRATAVGYVKLRAENERLKRIVDIAWCAAYEWKGSDSEALDRAMELLVAALATPSEGDPRG